MMGSPLTTAVVWVAGALLVALGYRSWGWPGVALGVGGVLFWLLLHFTRTMGVLRRAAARPIGHIDSAVMLHSRLRPGLKLLDVVGLCRSLGSLQSPKDEQPERYRWTDPGDAWVDCEFQNGKLLRFELQRPPAGGKTAPGGGGTS
jgi:hypothetical protein